MRYLAHTVYVVRNTYADGSTTTDAIIREARREDVGVLSLGVLSKGRCVPLSDYETTQLALRYPLSQFDRDVNEEKRKDFSR